ncbi:dihydrolipoyl dehydrogenase [Nocardia thailandica]
MLEFDLLVIGGGPGGYVAAIRAAQRGLRVCVVEKDRPGGVCLNWGCIPTKAMVRSAEVYHALCTAAEFGVVAENVRYDFAVVRERRDAVVTELADGVAGLLEANGVTLIEGHARFVEPTVVEIHEAGASPTFDGGPRYAAPAGPAVRRVCARDVIVATGSVPAQLPIPGAELPGVVTSDGAFGLTEVPSRLVVIGGSAVGAEWASLFATYGAEVVVVEMRNRLVPSEDDEVGEALGRSFRRRGITVLTGATVTAITEGDGGALRVSIAGPAAHELDADIVLVGVGRRPNTAQLGLEVVGVETDARGFIEVDDRLRTSVEHVYAIGDVTGRALLAHVASHQGVAAADMIAGHGAHLDYSVIPAATFTHPEIASVGLTEDAARAAGHEVVIAKFPFAALGRAKTVGETEGFVKIIAGRAHREVLGVHIIGPSASDLIAEGALAMSLEATLEELAGTIHAHPTLGEIGMEAAMAGLGLPVHIAPRKKR